MKSKICFLVLIIAALNLAAFGQEVTEVNSQIARRLLLGRHMLSLQWISWDEFGRADVTEKNGVLSLKGVQKGRGNNDILEIEGVITEVNRYDFRFKGKISIRVSYNNNGEKCIREGEMTFKITGKRKYWRLQEMENPCEEIIDYVDIYFRR